MHLLRICLVVLVGMLAACEKQEQEPKSIVEDRFGRTAEPGTAREAVTFQELSFMIRMREPEAEILGQIAKRGLAEPLDAKSETALRELSIPAPLLQSLKTSVYLLTKAERELYAARVEKRKQAISAARSSDETFLADNRKELDKRIRSAEVSRIENRKAAEWARVVELEGKLSQERYSKNNLSPYQGVKRELDEAREKYNRSSSEVFKVSGKSR